MLDVQNNENQDFLPIGAVCCVRSDLFKIWPTTKNPNQNSHNYIVKKERNQTQQIDFPNATTTTPYRTTVVRGYDVTFHMLCWRNQWEVRGYRLIATADLCCGRDVFVKYNNTATDQAEAVEAEVVGRWCRK